ncbi:apoptosis-inducing factor 3-like isoform X2 [Toxorhynchites rutilus septentrionalis]|uniref:apoptosis-inducing factor 3-like isoform X2 n=1 Tax=Toxorhynchites rutilus septentrionalis TaxID=329112 RepID=UPI00247A7EF7|nr:apoptosis-inducing factor 3-like isoform X2 [Toxorhynchites rutilus septentrionalis]
MGCSSSKQISDAETETKVTGMMNAADEYVENFICGENDISENEMKPFDLEGGKILLIKQNGKLSAIGNKCTHYGALLSTGALGNGRVRCPWHGACFNIETGDIEDFPGQDSLPCFKVSVEQGRVKIRAKRQELLSSKRTKPMVRKLSDDERTFIVIGGGPSGAICAETLRQEGFTGRVVMINKEPCLPYDRVLVSKVMDFELDKKLLRNHQFYADNDVETITGTEVTSLDSQNQEISLSNGYKIKYDKVYIATGSKARKLNIEGAHLPNVFVLRSNEDAKSLNSQLSPDKHVVVLGVSFIGLEAAAYCVNKVSKVTVIGRGSVPLTESFGAEIGLRIMQMFEEQGIEFVMKSGIRKCIGENTKLTAVELNDGSILKADICVMGVGSTLYTTFLEGSELKLNKNGSIDTNLYLETNIPGIYVGGDIANAPIYCNNNELATIGHYPLAQYHGRVAALNMLGKTTELRAVPYFWTMLFGKGFRYAGYGTPHETIIEGDLKQLKFVAFYLNEAGKVIGMASCGRDPVVSQFAEYMSQGKSLHKNQLSPDPFTWIK